MILRRCLTYVQWQIFDNMTVLELYDVRTQRVRANKLRRGERRSGSDYELATFMFLTLKLLKQNLNKWMKIASMWGHILVTVWFSIVKALGVSEFWRVSFLKGQCHEDFAVLRPESVAKSLLWGFYHKQNASVKLRQRYQIHFIREG